MYVSLVMPAGGGYGDPKDRSHKAVKQDVAEGYVSINAAKNIYGL